MMDLATLSGYALHVGTAYMFAYLAYLAVRTEAARGRSPYSAAPYDSGHLVLRRRYI